jgi:hypothetical protein
MSATNTPGTRHGRRAPRTVRRAPAWAGVGTRVRRPRDRADAVERALGMVALLLCLAGCGGGPATAVPIGQPTATMPPAATSSAASPHAAAGQGRRWTFDGDAAGALPPGAVAFSGIWAVRAEADAPSQPNALCQTGAATFPAVSLGSAMYTDLVLSARFKPLAGKEDQAAGLIFRVQDADNYYILRANALEGNVNLYKYARGQRSGLKEGAATVAAGRWQELRVEVAGNRFRGFLDGQPVVEASDDTFQAGQIGLWTKADSVSCFDDVEVAAKAP